MYCVAFILFSFGTERKKTQNHGKKEFGSKQKIPKAVVRTANQVQSNPSDL
jgi:hypothetical protein